MGRYEVGPECGHVWPQLGKAHQARVKRIEGRIIGDATVECSGRLNELMKMRFDGFKILGRKTHGAKDNYRHAISPNLVPPFFLTPQSQSAYHLDSASYGVG